MSDNGCGKKKQLTDRKKLPLETCITVTVIYVNLYPPSPASIGAYSFWPVRLFVC